jgi:hypothetical protein
MYYGCWGFELGPNGTPACPDFTPAGAASIQTTKKRSGSYGLLCPAASGGTAYGVWCDFEGATVIGLQDWCGIRFYKQPSDRPTSVDRMMYKFSGGTGSTELRQRASDGKLDLLYGSVLKGTSATALTDPAKYYCIEVLEDKVNDKLKLYIDGVLQLDISVTINLLNYQALTLGYYQTEAEAVEAVFDDVSLVCGVNAEGPRVPGQGRVLLMEVDPAGPEGTYSGLSRNTGSNDYECVKDYPHTAETNYLYTTGDPAIKESHNLTQPVPAGASAINAVMPFLVECEPTDVTCTIKVGLRVGTTDHLDAGYEQARKHTGYKAFGQLQSYCPTYAELAALQVLYEVDNAGAGSVHITQAAVQVDYAIEAAGEAENLKPIAGATSLVLAPTFAGDYVQGDADVMAYAHVEVWNDAETVEVWDSGDVANTGTRFLVGCLTDLTPGATYKWRARCKDASGSYGAWSAFQSLIIDSPPTTPTGCGPSGGETVLDTTPDLTWTHNDPNSHAQRFFETELRRNDTGTLVSGYPRTPAGAADGFAGDFVDDDSLPTAKTWSKRGTWVAALAQGWCFDLDTGKAIATLDSGLADCKVRAKVKFRVGNGIAFRVVNKTAGSEDLWVLKFVAGSAYGGRVKLGRYDGSSSEVDVAITSDQDLVSGQYYWLMALLSGDHIACYLDGVLLSELSTISSANQAATLHGLYAEDSTALPEFDEFLVQATAGETALDTAPTLAQPVTYKWRVRTHDGQGWGAWSDWSIFTCVAGLTVEIVLPAEGQILVAAPGFCHWGTFGGSGGQTEYRAILYAADGVTVLEDSGWVSSWIEYHTYAYTGWENLTTYKLKVGVRDNSGPPKLEGWSALLTFSTNWAPPATLTNVSVAAVLTGNPHLLLSWDQSDEADFLRYEVWRRKNGETAYIRIATISEKTTVAYNDYRVDLKYTWEYVVKQVITVLTDQVPSDPSTMASASVGILDSAYLHDTTDEASAYVALQLAPDRSFRHHIDRSVRFPWGSTKPVEIVGEAEWWTFQISMTWLMEDDANRAVLSAMQVNGNTLCYRDGRGRKYFCRPDETGEADAWPAQFEVTIPMTEVDFTEVM